MKYFYYLVLFFIIQSGFCQTKSNVEKDKIATILEDYFDLEREAIHLHLNKTTFITNESIWYQGYIINRKTNKPYFTSNVFVILYDEKGNKLSEKLVYANNGTFSGEINISNNFQSGNYYIQVYTNWMNNFSENESTIQNIKIINPLEGAKNYNKVNPNSLALFATPEGGNLILGTTNSVGVQFKDCRGNAPKNCEVTLQNDLGVILKTIKLNQFGYGKFEFIPLNISYKIVANYDNKIIEKSLPLANANGLSIIVNNYSNPDKTIININTNARTIENLKSKKIFLVIHQDQKYSINEITIDKSKLEQTFSIPNSVLSTGVNTIRIIDSDFMEYTSRLIYVYPKIEKSITFFKNQQKSNNINLVGYSKYANASLSSSFLPEKSLAWDDNDNIFVGITINPYLTEYLPHASYYFNNPNRIQYYELDLALLNQQTKKYDWNYMKVTKPTSYFSFDIGLTVKGKINQEIKDKTFHKVKIKSYKYLILLNSDVTEDGDYNFEHLLLPDSSNIEISLSKLPDFETIGSKLSPTILNRNRPFYKEFKIKIPEHCDDLLENIDLDNFEFINQKIINLAEVNVENNSVSGLLYENQFGNANLTGYKIEGHLENQDLFRFIELHGFKVDNSSGQIAIYNRQQNSFNAAQSSPAIFIDGRQIYSFIEIEFLHMTDIDEIFLNPFAIVPNMGNFQGIIKIYTKQIKRSQYIPYKNQNEFYISEGFSRYSDFKNADYQNIGYNGFNYLGLLDWSPRMHTDKDGTFLIKLTDYNQQKGKSIIQGMTTDGTLFQEESLVELK